MVDECEKCVEEINQLMERRDEIEGVDDAVTKIQLKAELLDEMVLLAEHVRGVLGRSDK